MDSSTKVLETGIEAQVGKALKNLIDILKVEGLTYKNGEIG